MPYQNSPTPGASDAATPATAPVAPVPGTTEPQGEAKATGAPEAEIARIDVNTLPPEVRAIYEKAHSDMLRDYKAKTAGLSEREKVLGESEQHAKLYQALLQDSDFVNYWQNRASGNGSAKRTLPFTEEEWEASKESPEAFHALVSKLTQPLQQKLVNNEISEVIAEFAEETEEVEKDGVKTQVQKRPLFYDFEEAGLISHYMSRNPAKSMAEYQAKLVGAYEWAKGQYERIYKRGQEDALQSVKAKIGRSTLPSGDITVSGDAYQGKDPKKLTTQEAWDLAKQGKTVLR